MRLAHGWSQADAAEAWNARWPHDPKTFKSFSYWENWPSPTGHAPSLSVLDSLAKLYRCAVADLVAGCGDHTVGRADPAETDRATLTWQVRNLNLHELTHSVDLWSRRLPDLERRPLLLKLGAATATVAAIEPDIDSNASRPMSRPDLGGAWISTYEYPSRSRASRLSSSHTVDLRIQEGRLLGTSRADDSGSHLQLDLAVDGAVVTGSWTERTSPMGHYQAAIYHGILQLVLDPTSTAMTGQWLGIGKRYTINHGEWRLERPRP